MVQVFAQTGPPAAADQRGSWDEEDMNGYQLLNEVGSGGTLSSLFTILSLFTEDVKMSWQDGEPAVVAPEEAPDILTMPIRNRTKRADSDVSQLDLVPEPAGHSHRRDESVSSSSPSTVHGSGPTPSTTFNPFTTPTASRASSPPLRGHPFSQKDLNAPTQLHHGVVARATVDTTLAVIPAEAFRRLTKKFPKATGHIVQG